MNSDLTDEEFQKKKEKLFALSKNKGLDQWEAIFKHYDLDIEKAKTSGLYVPQMGGYVKILFDKETDRWVYTIIDPTYS